MFAFSLAKELGIPVYQLMEMPSDEFTMWKAYSALEREELNAEKMKAGLKR